METTARTVPLDPKRAGTRRVGLADGAVKRIKAMLAREANPEAFFRISVTGGGCSGFQYDFSFDTVMGEEDLIFERDGVRLVIDEMSLSFVDGAELRYEEELVGAYFTIENPNATSSCGCGSSFSI
ncbi:MAG: iron-sulfur cluster insertion protein ErpA [Rhodospirillaceae bacterium]|nr:iron-sulfur cluster insertion protein ErpA [Rhodospirillaceae bacterium]MBT6116563.1 iron-sulfur cluster insertion protein ErpA [Rhodospirillaceae bacterium]